MQYQYMLLDFDGTILDSAVLERQALTLLFEQMGYPLTEEMADYYHQLNIRYWARFEAGEITPDQLRRGRFEEMFADFGIRGHDPLEMNRAFIGHSATLGPMYEGTLEVLEALHERCCMCMVTNGFTRTQYGKIAASGVGFCFDHLFIAEEMDARKPGRAFFQAVHDKLGRPPLEEMLITGDSLKADILGGANFGIDTCWFNPEGTENGTGVTPTYEIRRLGELLGL